MTTYACPVCSGPHASDPPTRLVCAEDGVEVKDDSGICPTHGTGACLVPEWESWVTDLKADLPTGKDYEDLMAGWEATLVRWEDALADVLLASFERLQAVVVARLKGPKARRHTQWWNPPGERKIDVTDIVPEARYRQELVSDTMTVFARVYSDTATGIVEGLGGVPGGEEGPLPGWLTGEEPTPRERVPHEPRTGVRKRGLEYPQPKGGLWGFDPRIGDSIRRRASRIDGFGQTRCDQVRRLIAASDAAGEPLDMVVNRLDEYFKQGPVWARRVARTEIAGGVNAASLIGAYQSRVVGSKTWIATMDNKTRPTHRVANGQTRKLDEMFSVGDSLLAHPGDDHTWYMQAENSGLVQGLGEPMPPDFIEMQMRAPLFDLEVAAFREIVNCRCTMIFNVDEDAITKAQRAQTEASPPMDRATSVKNAEQALRDRWNIEADYSKLDLKTANEINRGIDDVMRRAQAAGDWDGRLARVDIGMHDEDIPYQWMRSLTARWQVARPAQHIPEHYVPGGSLPPLPGESRVEGIVTLAWDAENHRWLHGAEAAAFRAAHPRAPLRPPVRTFVPAVDLPATSAGWQPGSIALDGTWFGTAAARSEMRDYLDWGAGDTVGAVRAGTGTVYGETVRTTADQVIAYCERDVTHAYGVQDGIASILRGYGIDPVAVWQPRFSGPTKMLIAATWSQESAKSYRHLLREAFADVLCNGVTGARPINVELYNLLISEAAR